MPDPSGSDTRPSGDPEMARALADIARRSQAIVSDFLAYQREQGLELDPLKVSNAFMKLTARMMADPAALWQAQTELWQSYLSLWEQTARRMAGETPGPEAEPAKGDRRFSDPAWTENAVFDFIKQSYLLTSDWLQSTVENVQGLDDQTAKKVTFYTRQFADAMSPTNFLMTNPQVLRETAESRGENLVRGLENLVEDLEKGNGRLQISMTDEDAFSVGGNIALSEGKVVFQNELMQLIQYAPSTEAVARRPLLIIPPWINKFYILDLQPKNSLIKWAVEQGLTVFVISWVNPDARLADKTFEDYLNDGPLAALEAIERATGEREANVVGYCLGGTLLASLLAYMAAAGDDRVKSATYLASLVDFRDAGDLTVFIDEEQLAYLEARMAKKGYLEGADMATTFNMLRANDLIWSFVINNYMLGKDPFPFDLLYWNADSTRMPAAMHSFYLRKMYQENRLIEPGGITLNDTPIDVRKIEVPAYILSTREDHIAPWKATYAATGLYAGRVRFVLSASGHIAGVVNPPAAEKYCYWTNARLTKDPDAWLAKAEQHGGSWWLDWKRWIARFGGGKVPARAPGDGKLKPIEDAPGSYVKVKARD